MTVGTPSPNSGQLTRQAALRTRLSELLTKGPLVAEPATPPPARDAIVSHIEVNEQHGVGMLLKRLFGGQAGILTVRSQDHFGGSDELGQKPVRFRHGSAPRQAVYAAVLGLDVRIGRVLCCPYYPDDVRNAVALADVHGAPMCTWLMDDQNVVEYGIPDTLLGELLQKSRVRFAISGRMRDAYEQKYRLSFGVLPPTLSPHLLRCEPLEIAPKGCVPGRAAIVGNIWGPRWLSVLREALAGSGLRLDWFCNSGTRWLEDSIDALKRDGLMVRGRISTERELKREMETRPLAIVPSGTLDDQDDRRAIATLSLPSRVVFLAAAANTPLLVLGSEETAAARFVKAFGLGLTAPYQAGAILRAIGELIEADVQRRIRARAAALAPAFSSAGVRDFIWRSLELGAAADRRYEDLFPRSDLPPHPERRP